MKKTMILFIITLFLASSFSVAVQTKSDRTTDETYLLDNIRFDELSKFENKMNYSISETTESQPIDYNTNPTSVTTPTANIDDALMDSCWPMKSQNRRHTGLSPYNTPDSRGSINWTYETNDYIEGGIVIDDEGVLYFGDFNCYLRAVYPNGKLKWKFNTHGWIWSTPALASDGTVYIGTYENDFYAINPNGTLKWKFDAMSSISTSPAISKDGCVYFGTMGFPDDTGCKIYCFNPNGTKKWEYQTGYKIVSDPAIADDGTIYIGSGDSYMYALNPDGTLKWRYKTGDYVNFHPSIAEDGTIYFDSFDGYFYALNPDGTLQWKSEGYGEGIGGAAIDEEGIIYVGGGKLSAVYPNGTGKWRYKFDDYVHTAHSTPVVSADGIVYVGVSNEDDYEGCIYAINSDDGSLKWMRKIGNYECDSSPAIAKDGTVYIGSSSREPSHDYGALYAFCSGDLNNKPNKPSIDGTTYGKMGESYTYVFNGSDPDNDLIYYQVNWGDGANSGWLGPHESGESIELSHTWTQKQYEYSIMAKIKDEHGRESEFSYLRVFMPKSRLNNGIWILFDWLKEFFDIGFFT